MTRNEQQKLGQHLLELFGQVYARQLPDGWKVDSPAMAATLSLLDWCDFCLRNHLLPERIIEGALDGMRKRPLKTADQQDEEFRREVPQEASKPVPSNSGGDHKHQGQPGDGGSPGDVEVSPDRMAPDAPGDDDSEDGIESHFR